MKSPVTFLVGVITGAALAGIAVWAAPPVTATSIQTAAGKAQAKVVLENDRVRVREVVFPPGVTRTGQHTHEHAHVGVILTEGALVFTEDGKSETVKFTAGQVGFREANATHDVGNPGTRDMRVIEVELKK